jgi:anti-sigma factor ChrR (cupin superfamily)
MAWQDRFRALGDELTAGKITTDEYRERVEEILAAADREAAETTTPKTAERTAPKTKVHIPASAAREAPTGEMTQIVGNPDETAPIGEPSGDRISEKLAGSDRETSEN